jgi:hypothetical protein
MNCLLQRWRRAPGWSRLATFSSSTAQRHEGISRDAKAFVHLVSWWSFRISSKSEPSMREGCGSFMQSPATSTIPVAARIQARNPDPYGGRGVRLVPLYDVVVAPAVRRLLFMLFGRWESYVPIYLRPALAPCARRNWTTDSYLRFRAASRAVRPSVLTALTSTPSSAVNLTASSVSPSRSLRSG